VNLYHILMHDVSIENMFDIVDQNHTVKSIVYVQIFFCCESDRKDSGSAC